MARENHHQIVSPFAGIKAMLDWDADTYRDLPWQGDQDPYSIWVSEIILQQTRVEQGRPYYHRFLARFPNVETLAAATLENLYQVWDGLGYYSRARNMHRAAQMIVDQYEGIFPSSYKALMELPGIGPYTAAAIASFAFRLPYAVVDGNVQRVLSRWYAYDGELGKPDTIRWFQSAADQQIKNHPAAAVNQAMMNFGAMVCTPKQPSCTACPVREHCQAYDLNLVEILPVKKTKPPKKDRYFHFLHLSRGAESLVMLRKDKDVWKGLYTFVSIETASGEDSLGIKEWKALDILADLQLSTYTRISTTYRQALTHQRIFAIFYQIDIGKQTISGLDKDTYRWIKGPLAGQVPMPGIMKTYLSDNVLTLF